VYSVPGQTECSNTLTAIFRIGTQTSCWCTEATNSTNRFLMKIINNTDIEDLVVHHSVQEVPGSRSDCSLPSTICIWETAGPHRASDPTLSCRSVSATSLPPCHPGQSGYDAHYELPSKIAAPSHHSQAPGG
jgi:hypothetical protein